MADCGRRLSTDTELLEDCNVVEMRHFISLAQLKLGGAVTLVVLLVVAQAFCCVRRRCKF